MSVLGRLWAVAWNFLALFGLAAVVSLLYFEWYVHTFPDLPLSAPAPRDEVSPVARRLAERVTPGLSKVAVGLEDEVVASAGGAVKSWAVRQAYPFFLRQIPAVAEEGCDQLLDYLDSRPLSELAADLLEHAKAEGRGGDVHWTVRAAAERR